MVIVVGEIYEGVVTGVTKFGAFVKLQDGTTGLVHISEVADTYVKEISDFIKIGDEVKAKVVSVGDNGKMGLSIKQAMPKPVAPPRPKYNAPRDNFQSRPQYNNNNSNYNNQNHNNQNQFEDKLAEFMKNSNEKLTQLKRHQDGRKGR